MHTNSKPLTSQRSSLPIAPSQLAYRGPNKRDASNSQSRIDRASALRTSRAPPNNATGADPRARIPYSQNWPKCCGSLLYSNSPRRQSSAQAPVAARPADHRHAAAIGPSILLADILTPLVSALFPHGALAFFSHGRPTGLSGIHRHPPGQGSNALPTRHAGNGRTAIDRYGDVSARRARPPFDRCESQSLASTTSKWLENCGAWWASPTRRRPHVRPPPTQFWPNFGLRAAMAAWFKRPACELTTVPAATRRPRASMRCV